jgi:Holliday junction resolvase-like predicted endonuclease
LLESKNSSKQKSGKRSQLHGRQCENRALEHYLSRGYELLARNQKIRGVEIDLILRAHNIVLVEVKSLASRDQLHFRLSFRQQRRLLEARQYYENLKSCLVELRVAYVGADQQIMELRIEDHL